MFTTDPSDAIHYLNMLWYQLGSTLSTGVSGVVVFAILFFLVISGFKPWLFKKIVWLLLVAIALALGFAHIVGKF